VTTDCGACAAGCYAITPEISVCPDRAAPIATDCSADVAKADNACACEGRTCAAGQQCYKELVAWDGSEVHNVCGPDPQCLTNTDCAAGQVCVPPFGASPGVILTDRGGVCVTPECHVDADCTSAPCGACRLLVKQVSVNSGRDALDGIKCVYGTSTN
jgi:Cys-rich repeat protein